METEPKHPEHEYNESILEKDMLDWAEQQAQKQRDPKEQEWLRGLSGLQLFGAYQNNFWTRLQHSCELYNADGSVAEGEEEYAASSEKRHKAGMYRNIRTIIADLGYDQETLKEFGKNPSLSRGSRMTDQELEIVKKVFLEMRKRGYERLDLI